MFFAITFVLVTALAWMGWRLVRQDRALAGQRLEERRENAADLAVAALQKTLLPARRAPDAAEHGGSPPLSGQAAEFAAGLPEDSLLLIFRSNDLEGFPEHRLLFYPNIPATPAAESAASLPPRRLWNSRNRIIPKLPVSYAH